MTIKELKNICKIYGVILDIKQRSLCLDNSKLPQYNFAEFYVENVGYNSDIHDNDRLETIIFYENIELNFDKTDWYFSVYATDRLDENHITSKKMEKVIKNCIDLKNKMCLTIKEYKIKKRLEALKNDFI